MPKPPITNFSSILINPSPTNNNNGLYLPQLTPGQITGIPAAILEYGGLIYNANTNEVQTYTTNGWVALNPGGGAGGNVRWMGGTSVANHIAVFSDTTGKIIQDSAVDIAQVPAPLISVFLGGELIQKSLTTVNEIGNLGHIKFINDIGLIFVDSLIPVEFITNNYSGSNYQTCSLFTGGLPSSSTTPSALVELQSTTGALLLSRLTNTQVGALTTPVGGMIAYNSTANQLINYTNGAWSSIYSSPGLTNNLVLQSNSSDPTGTNGLIYYNTTSNIIKTYVNGSYGSVYVSPGTTNNLILQSSNTNPLSTGINGQIYYNSGNNTIRALVNNDWGVIYISPPTSGSSDLVLQSRNNNSIPSVNGTLYYNTTSNNIRAYTNSVWGSAYISPTTLDSNLVLQSDGSDPISTAINGLLYYNNGLNVIRSYTNSVWGSVYISPGITNNLVLQNNSSDPAVYLTNGTLYYNTTNKNFRVYGDGTWGSIPVASLGVTCGQATFAVSATGITISTSAITTSSIVLITPSTGAAQYTVSVGTFVVANIINNSSFTVILQNPVLQAFTINWLIINP